MRKLRSYLILWFWMGVAKLLTSLESLLCGSATRSKTGGDMTERFNEGIIDDFLDARQACLGLCSIYEQTSHAHRCAKEDEAPEVKVVEKELLGTYLDAVQDAADRLLALADKIPDPVLERLLSTLPAPVLKDVLELQK